MRTPQLRLIESSSLETNAAIVTNSNRGPPVSELNRLAASPVAHWGCRDSEKLQGQAGYRTLQCRQVEWLGQVHVETDLS